MEQNAVDFLSTLIEANVIDHCLKMRSTVSLQEKKEIKEMSDRLSNLILSGLKEAIDQVKHEVGSCTCDYCMGLS